MRHIATVAALLFWIAVSLWLSLADLNADTERTPLHIGEVGRMKEATVLAADLEVYKAMQKIIDSGDKEGIREILRQLYPVNAGTQVRVIDTSGFFADLVQVRILSGGYRGEKGWTEVSKVVHQ